MINFIYEKPLLYEIIMGNINNVLWICFGNSARSPLAHGISLWHVRKLKRRFKSMKGLDDKVFLLLEFAGETDNLEIIDPKNH